MNTSLEAIPLDVLEAFVEVRTVKNRYHGWWIESQQKVADLEQELANYRDAEEARNDPN